MKQPFVLGVCACACACVCVCVCVCVRCAHLSFRDLIRKEALQDVEHIFLDLLLNARSPQEPSTDHERNTQSWRHPATCTRTPQVKEAETVE